MNNNQAVYRVNLKNNKKWIALTFDIGNGSKVPLPVIKILKKEQVDKATFFLSGTWARHYPEIARQVKYSGYEVGSHGYLHENYTEQTNKWIKKQSIKAEHALISTLGVHPRLIRTPNGDWNQRVVKTLKSRGYTTIQWSIDSLDWMKPGVKKIINNATARTKPGDIILLHASDTASQTPKALSTIIRILRAKGYEFVTVSELLKAGSPGVC
ncbi:polysaccharide deacetylase family protein [Paenibacillus sp. JZ16]|uniref:polysaccharide deacetylase family protein n=1 Tax=Paenibacillus sp. JZ16 TaxID=1906272 RepID=UPI00188CFBDF|nr:polysaccharide deacetylase family protein [Paenibacillus sp. JZ16]